MGSSQKTAKSILIKQREELHGLSDLTSTDRNPVALDQQSVGRLSRMDALQMQAMAEESERRRAFDLTRIDAALRRLDDGDYGYCVECGEEIAVKRLEIDPAASHCISCASLAER